MKKFIRENYSYLVVIVLVILIRTFIATPVIVSGSSMEPTLLDGQLLILNKIGKSFRKIERFDVVVIEDTNGELIIKRVIGLPGESVEYKNEKLYINGEEVVDEYGSGETGKFDIDDICRLSLEFATCNFNKIPEDYYIVLGDNREVSADSRIKGFIHKDEIKGAASLRIWPLSKIGTFN